MFSDLCLQIKTIIGESEFNSEDYLNGLSSPTISNIGKPKMVYAHMQSTGGFICGETKITLSLRLLAGGSYLDLSLLYETEVITRVIDGFDGRFTFVGGRWRIGF